MKEICCRQCCRLAKPRNLITFTNFITFEQTILTTHNSMAHYVNNYNFKNLIYNKITEQKNVNLLDARHFVMCFVENVVTSKIFTAKF